MLSSSRISYDSMAFSGTSLPRGKSSALGRTDPFLSVIDVYRSHFTVFWRRKDLLTEGRPFVFGSAMPHEQWKPAT
jgi:hypothetical protein